MTPPHDDPWTPLPELLAAYSDGELDNPAELDELRQRVERWLDEHPEGAEELDRHRRLAQLFEETRPMEPAPAVWAGVWSRVLGTRQLAGRGRALRVAAALTAVAAAVLAVITGIQSLRGPASQSTMPIESQNVADVPFAAQVGPLDLAENFTLLQVHEIDFRVLADADPQTELRSCGNHTAVVWGPLPGDCKK